MAAALHDDAQIVLARKIDRRGDVSRRFRGYRIDARPRGPAVDPAERLRQPNLVADIVRVLELLEDFRAGCVGRSADAGGERRVHLDEPARHIAIELLPTRFRRPRGIAGTNAGSWGRRLARGECRL